MPESRILDVRSLVPAERHRSILAAYQNLDAGSRFILVNDHDPRPLYYWFEAEQQGEFFWRFLDQGPRIWRVEIGRPKMSRATAR